MKLKKTLMIGLALVSGTLASNGAQMILNNVVGGPGDTLYATSTNTLMNGGVVAIGYFNTSAINPTTIADLASNISNFIIVTSAVPGSNSDTLGGSFAGYLEQTSFTSVSGGLVTPSNNSALLNRNIYEIVTSASSLAAATGTSEFALLKIGTFQDDGALENQYFGDPAGKTPIIGTLGTFNGDAGGGPGTYNTLKMAVVPEPSAALLGAIGALGLLRRRRI